MAKNSRFKYAYRDSASKLHKAVGDCLRSSKIFGGYEIYQEYPVSKISDAPGLSVFHFDWVIPKLKLIFEAHGIQHYKPVNFGGMSDEDAEVAFHDGRYRDTIKKEAALAAGWTVVEVPYNTKITEEKLIELYETAKVISDVKGTTYVQNYDSRATSSSNEYRERQLERAREYRKARYDKLRELKHKRSKV